ncbi:MAG: 4Fe-4S dicluster domain-containing protein [Berryella intestinalis]|uniref:4Fe-4S dicluster domain-containing protein n=1 Tax=Berryella intestinalis TaxID=1531429 RepID=UPI002A559701|nr:4Fe-4S dicluster domain-containing protein [Berryella intestinalis]MDD7369813.1 4Fe-4S dicluster domain-containing protein [Berryella intestinalis]MDY3129100.1 4Fe-4S dicluster domain-containing protein [Berryella intestinalis]
MQYGFYVNTDICTGCKACMTSCFDRNDLEVPQKFRKVYEFGGGDWTTDETGAFTSTAFGYYASMTCGHCDKPACVAACPTGAMQKNDETGLVDNDKDKCIGCMSCEKSCPYHHPVQMSDGLSHKCVLCTDEAADGEPDPVCAKACPVRAIEFGPIDDLRAKHGSVNEIGELKNETDPNVVFGLHRDAELGGTLRNPLEVSHEA